MTQDTRRHWYASHGAVWEETPDRIQMIAQCALKTLSVEEFEHNAQLIATAANVHEELLEACELYHRAIDILFARLIPLDKTFLPSQSGLPWEAIVKGKAAMDKAKGDAT